MDSERQLKKGAGNLCIVVAHPYGTKYSPLNR